MDTTDELLVLQISNLPPDLSDELIMKEILNFIGSSKGFKRAIFKRKTQQFKHLYIEFTNKAFIKGACNNLSGKFIHNMPINMTYVHKSILKSLSTKLKSTKKANNTETKSKWKTKTIPKKRRKIQNIITTDLHQDIVNDNPKSTVADNEKINMKINPNITLNISSNILTTSVSSNITPNDVCLTKMISKTDKNRTKHVLSSNEHKVYKYNPVLTTSVSTIDITSTTHDNDNEKDTQTSNKDIGRGLGNRDIGDRDVGGRDVADRDVGRRKDMDRDIDRDVGIRRDVDRDIDRDVGRDFDRDVGIYREIDKDIDRDVRRDVNNDNKTEQCYSIRVLLEANIKAISELIGVNGVSIKEIQRKSGCRIAIVNRYNSIFHICVFDGSVHDIIEGIQSVIDKMKPTDYSTNPCTIRILVEDKNIGYLMGYKACVVKQIQNRTNSIISTSKNFLHNSTEKAISICGRRNNVQYAAEMVVKQLVSNPIYVMFAKKPFDIKYQHYSTYYSLFERDINDMYRYEKYDKYDKYDRNDRNDYQYPHVYRSKPRSYTYKPRSRSRSRSRSKSKTSKYLTQSTSKSKSKSKSRSRSRSRSKTRSKSHSWYNSRSDFKSSSRSKSKSRSRSRSRSMSLSKCSC